MIKQLLVLTTLFLGLFLFTQTAFSIQLVQNEEKVTEDFDDSVLKDIEDIEIEKDEEDEEEEEEEEDEEDEEDIEEEELDEIDEEDIEEEEELDEIDEEDIEEEEELDEIDEEDIEEEEELDEIDEEDIEEEEELDEIDEEDIEEEEELDEIDEEDMEKTEPDDKDDLEVETEKLDGENGIKIEEEKLDDEEKEEIEEEPIADDSDLKTEEEPIEETDPSLEEPDTGKSDSTDLSEEGLNIISNIRYVAASNQIVIDSAQVISYQVRHNRKNNQIIIEILQAGLSKNLEWPYILKDFDTGFAMIQADKKDESTVRILIQIKEGYSFPIVVLGENGDQMTVAFQDSLKGISTIAKKGFKTDSSAGDNLDLSPKTVADFYFGKMDFSGHPLSFHVIDAPIKQVLRFISEESGLNMVIGEGVSGSITLKLENVPWDQAFHTILQVKGLGYIRQQNVAVIDTLQNIQKLTSNLEQMARNTQAVSAFKTKVIPVAYGNMNEITTKLTPLLTKAEGGREGNLIINKESSTIIIVDTEEVIKRVENLIKFLDKAPKQVMIEARIVDAVETFVENFGLAWDLSNNLPFTLNIGGLVDELASISGSFNVNNNASSGDLRLNGIPLLGNLGATLRIAETKGFAKVISSPKVVTLSGKAASITRNAPILIPKSVTRHEGTGAETETLEAVDIQIGLNVTPQVTSAGSVFLNVSITRSSAGPKAGERGQATSIQRSAKTQVLVKNGHTVVIGGIYQYDENSGNEGLPFFRHIPFLKFLFGSSSFSTAKSELLVFLTPKIIDTHH